jgi:hypothetical protein
MAASALGTLSFRGATAQAQAEKLPLVGESEPMAKALGYYAEASKVDTKKWTKRATPEGKKQFCDNCILFNSGKVTKDPQGPCSLFPKKHVMAKGWCNSWAQNPAAK